MIITKRKKFSDVFDKLKKSKKIFILGCGECATVVKTGGEKEVEDLKKRLLDKGKNVIKTAVPDAPCFDLKLSRLIRENKKVIDSVDTILIMACGLAVQNVKKILPEKLVLPVCDTSFIGSVDKTGKTFSQLCSACGDCVLDTTDGYCPITRCPKSMTNGPCGGMLGDKCEVNQENDCVWILIYKSLSKRNSLKTIKKFRNFKDYSVNTIPQCYKIQESK